MEKAICLGLAIHNHQPLGNFPFVFADAYQKAYLPFLELLERHPRIKVSLHYSGPLRDWMIAEHPDFLQRVAALVARGQVEIMTAGYYEPILVSIPEADRQGQIAKLSHKIQEDFGYQAVGAWLTERVWEPSLAKTLAQAGVEYTVVDDHHFRSAGIEGEIQGYYITEDQGFAVKIFASSQHLRYTLPWHDVEEVVAWLKSQAASGEMQIAVMGDDGEKFGLWPGTHRLAWEEEWLERFFQKLEESEPLIQTITLAEYARSKPPTGRVYLPTASYMEMTEWALPADPAARIEELRHRLRKEGREDILSFLRGGHWRNFLAKYPEINDLHKKMLLVHHKVYSLPPSQARDEAMDELWKAQGNDPYWHGSFGGVYLPHLRTVPYQHLIAAENILDRVQYPSGDWLEHTATEFRRDGRSQILVSGSKMNLYFAPAEGGTLFEWDWREKSLNLLDTLTRRPEGYHRKIQELAESIAQAAPGEEGQARTIHELARVKEPGLESLLQYDPYRRVGFIDHFFDEETTLDQFQNGTYREIGDFIGATYEHLVQEEKVGLTIALSRQGQMQVDAAPSPIHLQKSFRLLKGSTDLPVTYTLTNHGNRTIAVRFGVEVNLGLLSGHSPDAFYSVPGVVLDDPHLDSRGEMERVKKVSLVSKFLDIMVDCELEHEARFWRFPIQTVSSSEAGWEKVYQASCLVFIWNTILEPGKVGETKLTWRLRNGIHF